MGRVRDKKEIEHDAAELVVSALGAVSAEPRDTGSGEQIRDFDIVFEDGHEEPLEVTLDAQDAVVQTWERLDRVNELEADLSRCWSTSPGLYDRDGRGVVVDVREVRAALIPFLQGLERLEIHEFRTHELWIHPSLGPTARRLSGYGVGHGASSEVPPEHADVPRLHLASTRGGAVHSSLITKAVEAQVAKPDNQAKLAGCSAAPRRHLYVGLTSAGEAAGMAWWALLDVLNGDREVPPIPVLPESITTVWAGTGSGAIYVTPPDPWLLIRAAVDS
ncbi:MAG TPA: hypothetical protein VI540_04705 [Gaiellaceae bacterium]|nr:hypothetical protein [Gaiellaceae bacterium]